MDRVSNQIAPLRVILLEMSKLLRWTMIAVVALAIMVGFFIAK
jgi:hypothetical protein